MGGAIVSLDQPRPPASWRWGGPDWQARASTDVVTAITGATIQANDPARLAARWAEVLDLTAPRQSAEAFELALEGGALRFTRDADGRGEGLSAIRLAAARPERALAAARERGLSTSERSVTIGGVRLELDPAA